MAGLGLLGLQWSGVTTTLRCLCGTSVAADAGQGIADVHDPLLTLKGLRLFYELNAPAASLAARA